MTLEIMEQLQTRLLAWYRANLRDLPWRRTRDPYRIWISEVMLQQTRVETVKGYYRRFLDALPTLEALARAPEEQVLKLWEGLGYYSRARNLHSAARLALEKYGALPEDPEALRALPGFGEYTVGAVASIAWGARLPAVDGNVLRIFSRLERIHAPIDAREGRKQIEALAWACLPEGDAGEWNQALMELGACICKPRPDCALCPVQALCAAYAAGEADVLPLRAARAEKPVIPVAVALVRAGDAMLLMRRPKKGVLAGLWVFPMAEGTAQLEAPLQAGFLPDALCVQELPNAKHIFTHKIWDMRCAGWIASRCALPEGYRWADAREVESTMMPSAMKVYRKLAIEALGTRGDE